MDLASFYPYFIKDFNKIAIPLILILNIITNISTERFVKTENNIDDQDDASISKKTNIANRVNIVGDEIENMSKVKII